MHAAWRGLGGDAVVDLQEIEPKEIPPSTQPKQPIAYLTSQYARAGDTFIRAEVEALRKLGFTIQTFSIRAPAGGESISSDDIRRERQAKPETSLARAVIRFILARPVACDFASVAIRQRVAIGDAHQHTRRSRKIMAPGISARSILSWPAAEAKKDSPPPQPPRPQLRRGGDARLDPQRRFIQSHDSRPDRI